MKQRRSTAGENTTRRGAVLMDNTLVSFRRMMDQADSKMEKAIESMRLSKIKFVSIVGFNQLTNSPSIIMNFQGAQKPRSAR